MTLSPNPTTGAVMVKVKKKPTEIEAYQYVDHDAFVRDQAEGTLPVWLLAAFNNGTIAIGAGASQDKILIQSDTHGEVVANPTDWIMHGVEGELYPCKDSVFHATYAVLDDHVDIRDPSPEVN